MDIDLVISVPILDLPQISDLAWEAMADPPPWVPVMENQISMEELLSSSQ